jgi:serine protease inhibitor
MVGFQPFPYVVRDRVAGTILFMGRVADPTEKH